MVLARTVGPFWLAWSDVLGDAWGCTVSHDAGVYGTNMTGGRCAGDTHWWSICGFIMAHVLNWLPRAESKKKRVWNACTTIWWWYPIEQRIDGLRAVQIPSKMPHRFFLDRSPTLWGLAISRMLRFATSQNQRDRSPVVTLFQVIMANPGWYPCLGNPQPSFFGVITHILGV